MTSEVIYVCHLTLIKAVAHFFLIQLHVCAGGKVKSQKTLTYVANNSSARFSPGTIDYFMDAYFLGVHVASPLDSLLLSLISKHPQVLLWSYVLPERL